MISPEQLDTAKGGARALAPLLAAYHAALVEAGFSRDEALTLVARYQEQIIGAGIAARSARTPA